MPDIRKVDIVARDIPEAWFKCLEAVQDYGRKWVVTNGSYVGQMRWELDFVYLHILYPGTRPLVPTIPPGLSIPPPAVMTAEDEEKTGTLSVENYLPYMMSNAPLQENEQYTYGQRIEPQMEEIIHRYKTHGFGSNQECIAVARPEDITLEDPPCLRQIDIRVFDEKYLREGEVQALHFITLWRSWGCFNGLPLNLPALRLMQEYMADSIGVAAGEMIAVSKGLHLYDHAWDLARLRTAR